MSKMITVTGMALLSIGVVVPVQAQPVSGAGQVRLDSATTPVTAEAARRKGPKVKVKEATGRVANPAPAGGPAADAPVAPIASPEAARTGRPKIRDKTPTNDSVANPTPAAEPVAAPEAARTGGRPKERDDDARDTSRTGRPKIRDKPASDTSRTGRPKERDDGVRTHTKRTRATTPSRGSNLLLPALGGAAAIVAIIAAPSGNDKPSSP